MASSPLLRAFLDNLASVAVMYGVAFAVRVVLVGMSRVKHECCVHSGPGDSLNRIYVATWRWPLGRLHIQFRIDYIFHSTHFRTVSSRTISTTGSDHLLVVSEVVLKDSDSNR